jgi:hypothetical protein
VVVGGSLRKSEIAGNRVIELLDDAERFCFHRAAEMKPALVQEWLTHVRAKALAQARSELSPLMQHVRVGAIVAKDGILPDLDAVLATHIESIRPKAFFTATSSAKPVRFPVVSSHPIHSTSLRWANSPPNRGAETRSSRLWRPGK